MIGLEELNEVGLAVLTLHANHRRARARGRGLRPRGRGWGWGGGGISGARRRAARRRCGDGGSARPL
jgi:hypothetical protein